jgi:cobalamin synthase
MDITPRWFWPIALVPALIIVSLAATVLYEHHDAHGGGLLARPEGVGMELALYAGAVLLAYLLLLCAGPRLPKTRSENTGTSGGPPHC